MSELTQQQLEFMLNTTETLTRIEANQVRNIKDVAELCKVCAKIPTIEVGLNNHLATHDKFKTRVTYSIIVAVSSGLILSFVHFVIKLF